MTLRVAVLAAVLAALACKKDDRCGVGTARCGDSCVDPLSDEANCGGCGVRCDAAETCCSGTCRDPSTDPLACGGCGRACLVGAPCQGGTCGSCPAEIPDACPPDGPPGTCVNLQSGAGGYCGTCGMACQGTGVAGTDAACSAGACVCSGAATDCGANPRCVALQTDPQNCGSCAHRCTVASAVCVGGTCTCPGGLTECGTACVNTQTDARNCGGCGNDCPLTNDVCANGVCACPTSLPDACNGTCVNRQTDARNCGTCGNVCPLANDVCAAGSCACPAALPDVCGDTCVDLDTDERYCGTCEIACPAGVACTGGVCACPASDPVLCGSTCCAGDACCGGGTCQAAHDDGLGDAYFSCTPAGTHTRAAAEEAARAWMASPFAIHEIVPSCAVDCLGWETSSSCAVWCYGASPLSGFVGVNELSQGCDAACPFGQTNPWN